MSILTIIILIFSLLGALDRILGNRFGLGAEFSRGFSIFGVSALSSLGILILAPALGHWLIPAAQGFYALFGIDPSVIPASILACDIGGTTLSLALTKTPAIGLYNAFIVSSMMGCTLSYTIPVASAMVDSSQHKDMFLGFLCGIATIPVGCIAVGFWCGLTLWQILVTLLPLILISILLAVGLTLVPNLCVKLLLVFGKIIQTVSIVGLGLGIYTFFTGKALLPHMATLEDSAMICVSACVTLSGAFPLVFVLGKLLKKPATLLGKLLGINNDSAVGFLPTLVSSTTTFGFMKDMDPKGVVLNSAFGVSAAFTFGAHLAFTMAMDPAYVPPMIVAKLISGVASLFLALWICRRKDKKATEANENPT